MDIETIFRWPPTPAKWRALKDYLVSQRINAGTGLRATKGSTGILLRAAGKQSASHSGIRCAFGSVTSWMVGETLTKGISGGSVIAGPNVFEVENFAVDPDTDGYWVVWLETAVTANEEDGLILPGLAASVQTTMERGASYPSQVVPTTGSEAEGTSIIPLGSLMVADGVITFYPDGCGAFQITHCPGTLGYARG